MWYRFIVLAQLTYLPQPRPAARQQGRGSSVGSAGEFVAKELLGLVVVKVRCLLHCLRWRHYQLLATSP